MTMSPPICVLDISRLLGRVGRGPLTGIDRVERAWLAALSAGVGSMWTAARTAPGHVLLDRQGADGVLSRIDGAVPWGAPDALSRLRLRQPVARRRAMSDARRLAAARSCWGDGGAFHAGQLPEGAVWLSFGHARLPARLRPDVRLVVMVHDAIPLDHPEFASEGLPDRFAGWLADVGARADLVVYTTAAARASVERHYPSRLPPGMVAPLGIDRPARSPVPALPSGLDPARPVFVVLGTIEPRKNHAVLLDVWDRLEATLGPGRSPQLAVVGRRGWRNAAVFARLDVRRGGPGAVHEFADLDDTGVSSLLAASAGLLFPTIAEGFGLPAAEAAALGIPVVCSDLPVFREILGDYPVYLHPLESYAWHDTVLRLSASTARYPAPVLPDWEGHVRAVLDRIGLLPAARRRDECGSVSQ